MGTTKGEIVALNVTDGTESWRTQVGTEIGASPAVGDDEVFVHTIDDRLSALDVSDGRVIWTADNQMPLLTLREQLLRPMLKVCFFWNRRWKNRRLAGENGEPIWEQRLVLPEGRSELDRMVDVDASPLVSGSIVYGLAYQGNLVLLIAETAGHCGRYNFPVFRIWQRVMARYMSSMNLTKFLRWTRKQVKLVGRANPFSQRTNRASSIFKLSVVGDAEGICIFLLKETVA